MTHGIISGNALKVLESRYLQKDASGKIIETPQQLFSRVAAHIAKAELYLRSSSKLEKTEADFFRVMNELKFLPNSPTLMNAGLPRAQLSACFVLPIGDSIESIFSTLKYTAIIQQSGGGTGFNFSALRPSGDFISESSGISSGPVSFMKLYNAATENIKQGGKRRGANMGILNVDHPDILEFIDSKQKEGELSNFNISVGISNSFMKAVEQNNIWELKFEGNNKTVTTIKAVDLWNRIAENAWKSGDPGLVFLDTINEKNPTPFIGQINCTNPCGEVPLLEYEACNLGSIDIAKFAENKEIKWKELEETIYIAVRFLDNVIEMNNYIIPEIETITRGNRKIGLGIMGWANALIKMEIPYCSEQALLMGKKLMQFIADKSKDASVELALERGNFTNWANSIYYRETPIRNSTRTSIAPTGTISIIADTSSSIEPLFALMTTRENILDDQILSEVNPHFINYLHKNFLLSEDILSEVNRSGSIQKTSLPQNVKDLFRISLEIEPEWHLKHQVAFQEFTDNAVSKTINMPESCSVKDIKDAFLMAWKLKAKGVTVFRYGSKDQQVLRAGTEYHACKICI